MSTTYATIINGQELAQKLLKETILQVQDLESQQQRKPCLAVILVGNDPASQIYVRNKKQACTKVGIRSLEFILKESTTELELLHLIALLNRDPEVDGILLQLPLPPHLESTIIIDNILPQKDVDGFHRYNMGALALNCPAIHPCTPSGIMYLLDHIQLSYPGKHAVILGTSNIVGRPMALELINRGATVTICNSKTHNLAQLVKQANILISACGKPRFVQASWIKPGAVVIDVGINRLASGKLCGDVDYAAATAVASYITPVPGGVGPMTIAMLLQNTLYCHQINSKKP
jgi:methylenetetrahydrofolate dehydrogenase (NADP+)/methenyltetrahydrofolate cyclohydrolase